MMQTGVIIRRNPDMFIPNAYLQLALKNNASAYGAAIVDGEEGLKTTTGGKDDMTLEMFKSTMEAFPKRAITFQLFNSDGAINEADLFPQVLLSDADGNTRLAVFVDANMPGFAKKDSSRSAECHFVDDWLIPKFNDIAELVDGDLDKIMKYCARDNFRKDVLSQTVSRGAITLVSETEAITIATGDTCKEYPWGWVSNHYGYETEAEKKEEPVPKKNMFAKKSTIREAADPSAVAAQKGPISGTIDKVAEQLKNSAGVTPKYAVKKARPGDMSRKDRKGWFGTRIGYVPEGCDDDPPVEIEYYVDQTGKLLTWANVKKMGLDAVGLPKLNNPPRIGGGKDTSNNEIEGNELQNQPPQPSVSADILPIFSPKAREHLIKELGSDSVKKIIAETGDIVATAEQAKAMELKFADVMTQLGQKDRSIVDILKMPHEWFVHLEETAPRGTVSIILWNIKNMLLPRLAKESKKVTAEEVHVVAKDELKPEKRNMFAKKSAA